MQRKIKRFLRSIFISPLIAIVTLYILLEEVLQNVVKPFVDYISAWHILQNVEQFLQRRSPYTLFGIYVCKFATFSGIKFFSLYLISRGNVYGGPLLACGEMTGAVLTVWYARVALPRLLTLTWFASFYSKAVAIKTKLITTLKSMTFYQFAKRRAEQVRQQVRAIKVIIKRYAKGPSRLKAIYRFINHR